MNPNTWRDMGHMSNLSELEQKRGKMGMWAKKTHFSYSAHERERESRERSSNLSQRFTELGCSVFVGPRTKVHLRDESYTWVLETKEFAEDSSEEFGRLWVSRLRDFRKLRLRSKK